MNKQITKKVIKEVDRTFYVYSQGSIVVHIDMISVAHPNGQAISLTSPRAKQLMGKK